MGWMALEALLDAKHGERPVKMTDTRVFLVNQGNVAHYKADIRKKLDN